MQWLLRLPRFPQGVAALFFLLATLGILQIGGWQIQSSAEREADKFLKSTEQVGVQRNRFLNNLSNSGLISCGEEELSLLRKEIFLNYALAEGVLFKPGTNTIMCTTVSPDGGREITLPDTDFVMNEDPDISYWSNLEIYPHWAGAVNFLFKKGNVGVLIYDRWQTAIDPRFTMASYVLQEGGGTTVFSGQKSVLNGYNAGSFNPWHDYFFAEKCLPGRSKLCILMHWDTMAALKYEARSFAMMSLLNIILSIFVYRFLKKKADHNALVARRIKASVLSGGKELKCLYQPIMDARDGRVVGCEVLARYSDAYGDIGPDVFIPEVKKQNLTWIFTEEILAIALKELQPLIEARPRFRVSVNFFPDDLVDGRALQLRHSVPLRMASEMHVQLCFEVLETEIQSWDKMEQFREYVASNGFSVAIDDFGTGFSNISHVRRSGVDILKIDRSFIHELRREEQALRSSLVRPIIDIADSINAKVVAEGVETMEQRTILKELGVDFLQGFHFSRPVALEDFMDFIWMNQHLDSGRVIPLRKQSGKTADVG